MKVYGLTGGIAAGKSAASHRFAELGIAVIDSDRVGHQVLEPGGEAEQGVIEEFGEGILTGGHIDREKLGAIVFGDSAALKKLNQLVHPAVGRVIASRTAKFAEEGHNAIIIEAALHAENGKVGDHLEGLIVVDCPRAERIRRLIADRDMTEEEAIRRIESQTPPEVKISLAKWVILNSGDIDELRNQVDQVAAEL